VGGILESRWCLNRVMLEVDRCLGVHDRGVVRFLGRYAKSILEVKDIVTLEDRAISTGTTGSGMWMGRPFAWIQIVTSTAPFSRFIVKM
jgi:hypothetical protein